MGFNVDGGSPHKITVGAVGADRWEVEILRQSCMPGSIPRRGISSMIVAGPGPSVRS